MLTISQIRRRLHGCSTDRYIHQATSELLNCMYKLKELFHKVKHPNLLTHYSSPCLRTFIVNFVYNTHLLLNTSTPAQNPLHKHNS